MDHLGISSTNAQCAIVTGDPDRVPIISKLLGGGRELTNRRGFVCHEAQVEDAPLLIVSSGIGAPAMAIVVEELIELGIRTLVRVGTCGVVQPYLQPGDLVIPTGCIRDEGTTRQYISLDFPAVPDFNLTSGLMKTLKETGRAFFHGIVHCKDAYYSESPRKQLQPTEIALRWDSFRRAGVLATEMESSTLFVLGLLRGVRTASLLICVGEATRPDLLEPALKAATLAVAGNAPFMTALPPVSPPTDSRRSYLIAPGPGAGTENSDMIRDQNTLIHNQASLLGPDAAR